MRIFFKLPFAMFLCLLSTWATAQTITQSAFGMHIRCTPGGGQNPDCPTPTLWPSIPTAPDSSQPIGSLRFHDNGTKFGNIQARRSSDCNEATTSGCAWSAFDEWIRQARRRHVELLYTFSRTPEWACAKHSHCAPSDVPEDAAFLNFVRAVRDRAIDGRPAGCRSGDAADSGCIRFWEVWNEPNNGSSAFCGSIPDLVHLARLVSEAVKEKDGHAKVVSPGVGYTANYNGVSCTPGGIPVSGVCSKWRDRNGDSVAYICEYLRQRGSHPEDLAGRDYTDVVAFHAYPAHSRRQSLAEDTLIRRIDDLRTTMRDARLEPCEPGQTASCTQLWITETSWGNVSNGLSNDNEFGAVRCTLPQGCPRISPINDARVDACSPDHRGEQSGCWEEDQAAYLAKVYTLSLSLGVSRVFWYWWDGQPWGTLFCKTPNPAAGCSDKARSQPYLLDAALAYGEVERWLEHTIPKGCSQASDKTFHCTFQQANGFNEEIVWTSGQPHALNSEEFATATNLYGDTQPVTSNFKVGYSPTLLQGRRSSTRPTK